VKAVARRWIGLFGTSATAVHWQIRHISRI